MCSEIERISRSISRSATVDRRQSPCSYAWPSEMVAVENEGLGCLGCEFPAIGECPAQLVRSSSTEISPGWGWGRVELT